MKYLIFGLVALFCTQAIHANRPNNCKNDLAELQLAAVDFFIEFEPDHDESNGYVQGLQVICNEINDALKEYGTKTFGNGLSTLELQGKMNFFFEGFFTLEADFCDVVHRIQHKVFELNDAIRCFKISNNLTCQRRSPSNRCEADLNKLRCDLADFFEGVDKGFDKALRGLDALLDACRSLTKLSRNFVTNNQISCDPPNNGRDLLRSTRNFFVSFNSEHIRAHERLESIASCCNTLVDSINAWEARLMK